MHVRPPSELTTEALHRIGELYGIEAGIRGKSAAGRSLTTILRKTRCGR
ncbi:hypothetical protein ACZ87_00911 [Candidatus Erwinia dacicola]|uniref:Uncharacterized protein n=1 Tax=Candidatus Erwinia dacicola TaxID=252393 RepID=A0A328TS58_9GAMM|nr:hypothetical protein ACZ87_00911 [Candidatus Erwinia dacicola]